MIDDCVLPTCVCVCDLLRFRRTTYDSSLNREPHEPLPGYLVMGDYLLSHPFPVSRNYGTSAALVEQITRRPTTRPITISLSLTLSRYEAMCQPSKLAVIYCRRAGLSE